MHKGKIIPKKYRLLIGVPIINKVDELVDNITFANSIFPTNTTETEQRKEYQVKAIANCFQLQNYIVKLEKTVDSVTISSLDKYNNGKMTAEEIKRVFDSWRGSMLHRNARKSVYKIEKELKHALCLQL